MTTYFNDLVIYYEQIKEIESKKRIKNVEYPTSVKNIYSPENNCHQHLPYGLMKFGIDEYDIIEFFTWSFNNNKFSTKDEIDNFYKFIIKDIQQPKFKLLPKSLLNDISNLDDFKLYTLFIHALFEKTPSEFITNDLIRKIIKLLYNEKINFITYLNQKGLEFDVKTLKLLKDKQFNMANIKSKDININIKKYNSNMINTLFLEKDFETCKKKFYDSLKSNDIPSDKITQVFYEIDLYLNTLITYESIENLIKLKLYYEVDILEHDIYLLAEYGLTNKIYDENLVKQLIEYLTSKNIILNFFNQNNSIIKILKNPQSIRDPDDQYHWMKDCRINYREIFGNIIANGFNIKKYDLLK